VEEGLKKMWNHRSIILATVVMAGFGASQLAASTCGGSSLTDLNLISGLTTFSDSGTFGCDSTERAYTFTLDATSLLNLYTVSWASGGFAPILTLFNGGGAQIAVDHGGYYSTDPDLNTCGTRGIGTADNESTCLDAFISSYLDAGSYTLILTEAGNCAACGNYSNGDYTGFPDSNYTQYNHPYFTGHEWQGSGSTATFLSPNNGDQLNGGFEVHIDSFAPEPGTWVMSVSGIFLMALAWRRRTDRSRS